MIRIVSVGKMKSYNAEAKDYLQRIGKYSKVEFVEVKEGRNSNPEVVKQEERKNLLKAADGKFIIALDERGRKYDSLGFSGLLKKDAAFVIGGAFGLGREVLEKANLVLSLSDMTMQHDLAKIVLLEQIYRGFTILNKEKYHK